MKHCLVDLFKDCSNFSSGVKIGPTWVGGVMGFPYKLKKSSPKPQGLKLRYLA